MTDIVIAECMDEAAVEDLLAAIESCRVLEGN